MNRIYGDDRPDDRAEQQEKEVQLESSLFDQYGSVIAAVYHGFLTFSHSWRRHDVLRLSAIWGIQAI